MSSFNKNQCPGCPYGGLDFSRGLFDFFAAESMGVLYGSWAFGSGNPKPSLPQSTSTPQPTPKPSTTYKPSTTPTTTSTSHSLASTNIPSTSSTSSSTSIPTPTAKVPDAVPTDVIGQFYMIMIGMGGLAVAAGSEA